MPAKILYVDFKFSVPRAEYEKAVAPLADEFAKLDGLRWKVWTMNEAENTAGGVYLFESEASLNAFLEGSLAAQVTSHPALSDFTIKRFDTLDDISAVTRGPI